MYSTTDLDASNFVSTFNTAFYFVAVISLVLLTGLTVFMLYFVFKYNRKKNKVATQIEGNNLLEVLWTVIPILLALAMFYYGWAGWKPMNKPPEEGLKVTSIARMWNFSFVYENGKQSPDLVIPVNSPVIINLVSGSNPDPAGQHHPAHAGGSRERIRPLPHVGHGWFCRHQCARRVHARTHRYSRDIHRLSNWTAGFSGSDPLA